MQPGTWAPTAYRPFKVIFSLSIPGVISGITMVFVPAMTTFVISTLLGGSKILLIGNVIEAGIYQGQQLALRLRPFPGADGIHPHQHGICDEIR